MTEQEQATTPIRLTQAAGEEGQSKKKKKKNKAKEEAATADLVDGEQTEAVTESSTETPPPISEQLSQIFNLTNPTWDLFVVLFFAVSALLYGMSLGRDRIIVILVSIYMALGVVNSLPDFVLNITINENFAFQIGAFISIFIVLFFMISRSALLRTIGAGGKRGGLISTIIFSILHVGLLLSIALSFFPPEFMNRFAPLTQTIFTHEWAVFGWITAPILAMIVFGKREAEE